MALLILALFGFLFSQPILGEAQKLLYEGDRIIYSGKAKFFTKDLNLKANRVEVLLKDGKPVKVIATGNVSLSFKGQDRRASCQKLIYDLKSSTLHLIGNVSLEYGENLLRAQEVLYNLKTKEFSAKGGKVRTIIFPR